MSPKAYRNWQDFHWAVKAFKNTLVKELRLVELMDWIFHG